MVSLQRVESVIVTPGITGYTNGSISLLCFNVDLFVVCPR